MRHELSAVVVSAAVIVGLAGVAQAAPSAVIAPWPQANSSTRVRAVETTATHIVVAGKFASFRDVTGEAKNTANIAVFNHDGTWAATQPAIGGTGEVWDLEPYGTGVLVAGTFGTAPNKNLVAIDAGGGLTWFSGAPTLKAVTTDGVNVYGGGTSLTKWSSPSARVYSGRTKVVTDPGLRAHNTPPAYRDLLLADGGLYAACQCDEVGSLTADPGNDVKAVMKLDPQTGERDSMFALERVGTDTFGISLATDGYALYLGAGGSDYVARYGFDGLQHWKRDTSGSSQSVEIHDGELLVGGHFREVADAAGDNCGFKSSKPGTLDPNDECISKTGTASYSLGGVLTGWGVTLAGQYNWVWAIEPTSDGSLHIAGEFNKVNGVARNDYARLG